MKIRLPAQQPPEAESLLAALRTDKPAVLEALNSRFEPLSAEDGDRRSVSMPLGDDAALQRWALALQAGLIALDGKVRVSTNDSIVRLNYRAVLPDDWLQEAITAAGKRQYNLILDRIRQGDASLKANEQHPAYEKHYGRFLALFDDLRKLYSAIQKELYDPYKGYQEAMP